MPGVLEHAEPVAVASASEVEPVAGASEAAVVMAEIGDGLGAIVVYVPAEMNEQELEIRSATGAWDGTHVAVRERRLASGSVHAAFFGGREEGTWVIRPREGGLETIADVSAGTVTEVHLLDAGPTPDHKT